MLDDNIECTDATDSMTKGAPNPDNSLLRYFIKMSASSEDGMEIDLSYLDSLIQQGANVNTTDKYGQTVLHQVNEPKAS